MPDTWFIDFSKPQDLHELAAHLGVDVSLLRLITDSDSRAEFYRLHRIPKKNPRRKGEYRLVYEPIFESLKIAHKNLLRRFERFVQEVEPRYPHSCAFGYTKGRSTRQNAARHCGAPQILHADIENFFPTINLARLTRLFLSLNVKSNAASLLARFATVEDKLALGLNSSPLFANLICLDLDSKMFELAKAHGCMYTRYADDMTWSGQGSLPSRVEISTILSEEGFTLSDRKFYQTKRGQSHFVTGLSVFDPDLPRVPKRFKRRLRQEIYYCQKYGLKEHVKRANYSSFPSGVNKIDGSLKYVTGIEPQLGAMLREQWEAILTSEKVRPSYLPIQDQPIRSVTFFCDESEIASPDGPVLAIGCVAIEEIEKVQKAAESLLRFYEADPFYVGRKSKLEKKGLHYSDLTEEVRQHYIRILADLPIRGFVAYDLLSNYEDYEEAYVQLLGALLEKRFVYYDRADLSIVFEENNKVPFAAVRNRALLTYEYLKGQSSRRPVTFPKVTIGKKREDPCLSVVDFMLGVFGRYAVTPTEREESDFERLRDHFRLIVSIPTNEFFTRKNPFTSWPGGSPQRAPAEAIDFHTIQPKAGELSSASERREQPNQPLKEITQPPTVENNPDSPTAVDKNPSSKVLGATLNQSVAKPVSHQKVRRPFAKSKRESRVANQSSQHPILAAVFAVLGTLILNELHFPLWLTLPLWGALGLCIWQWPRIVKTGLRRWTLWIGLTVCLVVMGVYFLAFRQVAGIQGLQQENNPVYRVRVTVVDSANRPVKGAEIISVPSGEQKITESGSEIVIPNSILSQDRKLRVWAKKDNGILNGTSDLILGGDHYPAVTILLHHDRSARIKGEVKDEAGNPISGVSVYIQNYPNEKATTDGRGRFDLAAHAAPNEHVHLFVEAAGYQHWNDFIPAGGESVATISLAKRR